MIFKIFILGGLFCIANEIGRVADVLEKIANKKSEIPKTARLICEKKYPQRAKYYVYRKLLYVPRCTVTDCMGRNTRGYELKQKGRGYVEYARKGVVTVVRN